MKALGMYSPILSLFFRYDVIMTQHDVKTDDFVVFRLVRFCFNLNNTWSNNALGQYKFTLEVQGRQVEGQGQGITEKENQRNP